MAAEPAGIRTDDPWRVCHSRNFPDCSRRVTQRSMEDSSRLSPLPGHLSSIALSISSAYGTCAIALTAAGTLFPISTETYAAAPAVVRSFLRKDLIRSDSCFDSWINLSVSEIRRTIFLFSSSILPCNKAESSSSCFDLEMTCVLVSSNRAPSYAIIRLHKRPAPRKGARRRDV
jgi:hypothetical protein